MSWTTQLSRGCAALCLSLTAFAAQGATAYSNMYVFGDSLSDPGNDLLLTGDVPSPAYYTDGTNVGRFTNGLNYADRLAANFGLTITPAPTTSTPLPPQPTLPVINQNNYAHGGARSEYVGPALAAYGALSFNDQINAYKNTLISSGTLADPNALYVLWIGANDMSDALGLSLALGGDPTPVIDEVAQTVKDIVTAFVTLQAYGAKNFLIGNSPDLSLTPLAHGTAAMVEAAYGFPAAGVLQSFQDASIGFNMALSAALPNYVAPTTTVTYFDAFALQTAMTDNPAAYGLTNVSDACYDGPVEGIPGANPADHLCANPGEYLYFDSEHPTAVLHDWAARTIYAQLVPEPAGWALTLTALGLMGCIGRRRTRN